MKKGILYSFTLFCFFSYLFFFFTKQKLIMPLTKSYVTEHFYFFCYFLAINIVFLFVIIITTLFQFSDKKTEKRFFNKIILWFSLKIKKINIFWKSYDYYMQSINPDHVIYVFDFVNILLTWTKKQKTIFICSFIVLPRIVILCVFLLEIFVFFCIHYYFYFLLLLIFCLLFRIIVFVLKDLYPRYSEEAQDLIVMDVSDNQQIQYKLSPKHSNLVLERVLNDIYYPLMFLPGELDVNFLPLYKKLNLIILCIYHIIHIFGWLYILSLYPW